MLHVSNVTAGYGDLVVVRSASLEIEQGQCVALIGWSGAGKTTLLKSIAGLVQPRCGDIQYLGESILCASAHQRVQKGIALVPEGRRLFTGMSVRDNLLVGAHLIRGRQVLADRCDMVFRVLPVLKERQHQIVGTLSGGEQQMCAIGRALMSMPKLLMVDELSLGLAPIVINRLIEALIAIRASGVTLVLVEQDVQLALQVATQVYIARHGTFSGPHDPAVLSKDGAFRREFLGRD